MINLDLVQPGALIRWHWPNKQSRTLGILLSVDEQYFTFHLFNQSEEGFPGAGNDFEMVFTREQLESKVHILSVVSQ